MASITKRPNGHYWVQIVDANDARQTIRLGATNVKAASKFARHVEMLQHARRMNDPIDPETRLWLPDLSDQLHDKLVKLDLVATRQGGRTLGEFLTAYLAEREHELKPGTHRQMSNTARLLLAHFGPRKRLDKITPSDASAWRGELAKTRSIAYAKTQSSTARTFAREAMRRGLFGGMPDPFSHLQGGTTRCSSERYVTPEHAGLVMEAMRAVTSEAEGRQARLLFALCRYAGLRSPSETHLLGWANVDHARMTLHVRSPKTERYEGHAARVVPIDARLYPVLSEAFDHAEPGEKRLVSMTWKPFERVLKLACQRAEVPSWPKLLKTLRSSCERELAARGVPQSQLSLLMGHSIIVSSKHYLGRDIGQETMMIMTTMTSMTTATGAKGEAVAAPFRTESLDTMDLAMDLPTGVQVAHQPEAKGEAVPERTIRKPKEIEGFGAGLKGRESAPETQKTPDKSGVFVSSASRTRTYNHPVNSGMLYH